MRILPAENLRIPGEGSSSQGKPGPKARPKGVVDGQLIDNSMPPYISFEDGVTQEDRRSGSWFSLFKQVGRVVGKSATQKPEK